MKRALIAVVLLLGIGVPVFPQVPASKIKIRAVLVDGDLNQKPVPHLDIIVSGEGGPAFVRQLRTDFSGYAAIAVAPGKYRLTTPLGLDFQGRHYAWEIETAIAGDSIVVDLSNDNARVNDADQLASSPDVPPEPARRVDDLTVLFQRYQKSVVTVWSEIGSGTGFIVDPAGLIVTNQHVIGPSELVSVQFDLTRKVAAKVLAVDAERDVAILYADVRAFPDAAPAPIARARTGQESAVEGERVFTIGSPLGLKKIITSGIVSKVEARAIISDVNINHGNSGGPLFNSAGEVIGLTTFLLPTPNGPSISGVIRIEETQSVLERARRKASILPLPSARLLPVEPAEPYPLAVLKNMARNVGFDARLYNFTVGAFDVSLETPVLIYKREEMPDLEAVKEKSKRNRPRGEHSPEGVEPLLDRYGWEEYTNEYRPVLTILAEAQLHEKIASLVGRELIPSIKPFGNARHLNFKADFYRMKLLCGGHEIEPIHRFRTPKIENDRDDSVTVTDATFAGSYVYGPQAISPSCGKVTLELFTEKDPTKAVSRDLDQKTINRIWEDFRPYIQMSRREPAGGGLRVDGPLTP